MITKKEKEIINSSGSCCNTSQLGIVNQDFSKRITALRFICAVFVVFIHNNLNAEIHFAGKNIIVEMPVWMQIIHNTFVYYWGDIAVPTFFIISGYLFFVKQKTFKIIIKSKYKGIILPYILWTLLAILLFYIAQNFEFSKPYFSQPENIIRTWKTSDYFHAFWAWNTSDGNDSLHTPFVTQFWYVRDLIVMMCISPLIKFCAQKYPITLLIFVTVLNSAEILSITKIEYGFTTALFYFTLGYYAVNNISKSIQFLDSIKWNDFIIAYCFSFSITVYSSLNSLSGCEFICWFNRLFTICLAFKVAGATTKNKKIYDILSYLSSFSFWIFAAHLPLVLTVIKKISIKVIPLHGCWILVIFFGSVIICVVLLMLLGIVLKKYLPRLYSLFNGGR